VNEFITWTPYFSVGDESLDAEHKTIVGLINRLHAAVAGSRTEADLRQIADELIRYTVTHFQHEEQVMLDCGYPDLEAHKFLHERLQERTIDFRAHLNIVKGPELLRFLKSWWCNHIQDKDKMYTPYLQVATW
jgi:hemerythrin-like metal-binding protein